MRVYSRCQFLFALFVTVGAICTPAAYAQPSSGAIAVTVTDPTGAIIPGATVTIQNPDSGYFRKGVTNGAGQFQFSNIPLDPYHVTASAKGFGAVAEDADVQSEVPVQMTIALKLAGAQTTVTVDAGDLLQKTAMAQTNLGRQSFAKLPLESQSSSLSSLVTLSAPGVTADANGMFHAMGDHASTSFSLDGQPISDQQSKTFSNQIPTGAIQSIKMIEGAPPAQYGDKTSLIVDVTTRSGLGVTKPTGEVTASYGSFGSSTAGFNLAYGKAGWGNFISANGLNTGRFLDGPEFSVFHDKGNEENVFDRFDYQITPRDSVHLNLMYERSWFQTPNSYDNLNVRNVVSGGTGADPVFGNVGDTDQHSKIGTFDIAPSYQKILGSNALFDLGVYVRKDAYQYYPSGNPLADLGPPSLQRESIGQERTLLNTGAHMDISYLKGINTFKAGAVYEQTILRENDTFGVVDPLLNAPCINTAGDAVAGFTDPSECSAFGDQPNIASNPNAPGSVYFPYFNPVLLPHDLTRGGSLYSFRGGTDVKELALYAEDEIKSGPWMANVGMRGDFYNGLTIARQAEPRVSVGYNVKPTNTVLRLSYARALESPFNENLILSSKGPFDPVVRALIPGVAAPILPGYRNAFHAGLEQTAGKYLVVSADYMWVYTRNAFDFSVFGNTPITFPIDWHNSKISGPVARVTIPNFYNFSAFVTMASVSARFFTPQIGGLGTVPAAAGAVTPTAFRIDHDERYNQTVHLQYQPWSRGPWLGFNWRFDSGMVAGSVPCFAGTATCEPSSTTLNGQPAVRMVSNDVPGVPLTADQEAAAGFYCGPQKATPTNPLPFVCPASEFGSKLVRIPAPGSENDDHNPQRIAPRSLFDIAIGDDNLFHGERYQWSVQATAVNIANQYSLYNYLSTFSGTHFVTPRALTVNLGFHF